MGGLLLDHKRTDTSDGDPILIHTSVKLVTLRKPFSIRTDGILIHTSVKLVTFLYLLFFFLGEF